jgi:hypothetical protein
MERVPIHSPERTSDRVSTDISELAEEKKAPRRSLWIPSRGMGILMVIGAVLRLRPYLFNRSLWVDEAMLAFSVVRLSFQDLMHTLPFYQAAPVGFLWAQHAVAKLLGSGEYALRLIPLVCGLGSIVLFYFLVRRLLAPGAQLLAMALFVFSPELIYYSSEAKQYELDLFVSLGLVCLAVLLPSRKRFMPWIALALAGVVAMWVSHPSVFVLAAIGSTSAVLAGREKRWKTLAAVTSAIGIWLFSFAVEFVVSLRNASGSSFLLRYWTGSFAPIPPRSLADVRWYIDTFFAMFGGLRGNWDLGHGLGSDLAGFLFVLGGLALWRRNRFYLATLTLPILFALLASGLHRYAFSGRLLLFFTPFLIVLIAQGFQSLVELPARYGRELALLLALFLLLEPALLESYRLIKPRQVEEVRSVMAYLQDHVKNNDIVYVYRGAVPAFLYYSDRLDFLEEQTVWCCVNIHPGSAVLGRTRKTWREYAQELQRLPAGTRVWMVFSHYEHDMDERQLFHHLLTTRARKVETYSASGANLDLFLIE